MEGGGGERVTLIRSPYAAASGSLQTLLRFWKMIAPAFLPGVDHRPHGLTI